jgi:hypothetical protein
MKRALIMVLMISGFAINTGAQNVLTGKEIYRVNCKAIVQIWMNGHFSGTGFIASADGLIVTANHVVTTRESAFKKYADDIKVVVNGAQNPYPATPVTTEVSDEQVNYDSAVLRIAASQLPHLTLGTWNEIDLGDSVIIIPSIPNIGCILLEGSVANRFSSITAFGPRPVNTILFQSPIRNGFSGSPIFNSKGHVVGIEDTKVFGISAALDQLRTGWIRVQSGGGTIRMGNVDVPNSFIELINNLDQNLISGLGSGVSIEYAEQQEENAQKPTTQH